MNSQALPGQARPKLLPDGVETRHLDQDMALTNRPESLAHAAEGLGADQAAPDAIVRREFPLRAALQAVLLLLLISVSEYFVGWQVHLSVVYLLPIYVATSKVGKPAGIAVSIASSLLSTGGDALAGQPIDHWAQEVAQVVIRASLFVAFALLFERLQRALARESDLARTDPLTGVPNRREFLELAAAEVGRAQRHNRPLTIAYVDVDDFKQINDRLGHGAGDKLLCAVATSIRSQLRVGDSVGRLGGDEFAICLPETDAEAASHVVRKLGAGLAALPPHGRDSATLSVGVVTFLSPPKAIGEMLDRADAALYDAKRDGKNQVKHDIVAG